MSSIIKDRRNKKVKGVCRVITMRGQGEKGSEGVKLEMACDEVRVVTDLKSPAGLRLVAAGMFVGVHLTVRRWL